MKSSEIKSKKSLQPQLRFPEFRDAGGWEEKLGDKLFDPISNKKHNSDLPILAITQEHGAIPRDKIDYRVSVTDKSIESYKVVEVGDFIISLRSFQGGIEYSSYKGLCSPAYIILRRKRDDHEGFFKHYLKTNRFIKDLNKDIEGIRDGKMVSYDQFSNILIPIPQSKKEQKKISDCLSSLDELIEAEDQKLEALQHHKKGLMQELFPFDGQTLPRLRFPEFQSAPEWEEKPISSIGDIITGSTPSTNQPQYYGGKWQFTSPADIGNNRYIEATKTTLSDEGFAETRPVKANSILFVCIGSIGKVAQNRERCATNQQINSIVPHATYSNSFIYFILEWHANQIAEIAGNHVVPIINKSTFGAVKIRLPKLPEQERIAECLSAIADLITAQTKKLESLRLHKKGLMQQLFPNASETENHNINTNNQNQ